MYACGMQLLAEYLADNRTSMMFGSGVRLLAAMSEQVILRFHLTTSMCLMHAYITTAMSPRKKRRNGVFYWQQGIYYAQVLSTCLAGCSKVSVSLFRCQNRGFMWPYHCGLRMHLLEQTRAHSEAAEIDYITGKRASTMFGCRVHVRP